MKLSENGLNFIKKHEGCYLYWYQLNDGGLTCGYGHYVPHATAAKMGIKKNQKITQKQADDYLRQDMAKFESGTASQVKQYGFNLNQNQFDALVSYAFNRGLGNAKGTNGLRQLLKNSKTVKDISNNFVVYWGTNTNYKKGLLNRRRAEKALFDTPVKASTTAKTTSASTHIGVATVLVDELNVRAGDSVTAPVIKQVTKGTGWKVHEIGKWGYRVGANAWIAKGAKYTSYKKV